MIDCKNFDGKYMYMEETKKLLKTRVREHRDEGEKIGDGMPFTRGDRKASKQKEIHQPSRIMWWSRRTM